MTRTHLLGFGLMLTLGACAELQSGKPGEVPLGKCTADVHQDWVGQRIDVLNDADPARRRPRALPDHPGDDGFPRGPAQHRRRQGRHHHPRLLRLRPRANRRPPRLTRKTS